MVGAKVSNLLDSTLSGFLKMVLWEKENGNLGQESSSKCVGSVCEQGCHYHKMPRPQLKIAIFFIIASKTEWQDS